MHFLHIDMTQLVEILPHVRQGPTCYRQVISSHDIDYVEQHLFGPHKLRINIWL